MVPTRTGKPGKMRKLFPVREKSGNFEQTEKVREFWAKYWKNEGILPKILGKLGTFSQFLFLFFLKLFNWSVCVKYIFVFVKLSNKYWKMERKYWKSQGNLSVRKCGNHGIVTSVWKFCFNWSCTRHINCLNSPFSSWCTGCGHGPLYEKYSVSMKFL